MTLTMFDAVDVANLPPGADAYGGYVDGSWPTYILVLAKFASKRALSIATSADHDADCLDVENGDALPSQAPRWVRRQIARGVIRPVIYISLAGVRNLLQILAAYGILRSDIRLWVAHYTYTEHICSVSCGLGMPTTADGTQWTNRANGCDQSLLDDTFFTAPPQPRMVNFPGDNMQKTTITVATDNGGSGWAPSPVNTANVVSASVAGIAPPLTQGSYTIAPMFVGTTGPTADSPNGQLIFEHASGQGMWTVEVWTADS